jgi:hypothetical protein
MLDRRRFSFGALLVAAAAPAVASASSKAIPEVAEGPRLGARYGVSQKGDTVEVTLTLVNQASTPVSVVWRYGSRLGPAVSVHRVGAPEGENLAEVVKLDRKEMMSRMGPRPQYLSLAAAGSPASEAEVGTYRFTAPEGPAGEIEIQVTVSTEGDIVELPLERVTVGNGGKVGA